MFKTYFDSTRNNKFDLYLDYYDALKYQYSRDIANKKILELHDKDMAKLVTIYNNEYGQKSLRKIDKLNISDQMKSYMYILKASEIRHNYIGYPIYPFFVKVVRSREKLGKYFENIHPEFFNNKRLLQLILDNQWSTLKNDILSVIANDKRSVKIFKEMDQDYHASVRSLKGTSKEYSNYNVNSMLDLVTNPYYTKTLKSMP
jgi:ribosomal protein S17E